MLKSLLLTLLLGGHGQLETRAAELERLPGTGSSADFVESKLRAFKLLTELDEISRLGQKLGAKLVAASADDFEEGLARVIDEPSFAEFLGRLWKLAIHVAADPDSVRLVEQFDLELGPQRDADELAARFLNEMMGVLNENEWLRASSPSSIRSMADQIDIEDIDPDELGPWLLESMYDPAATPMFADFVWATVRTVGRLVVLRHVEASGFTPSQVYTESLFEASRKDAEVLEKMVSNLLDPNPAARIALTVDSFKQRANRNSLDDLMEQLDEQPDAWTKKLGTPPLDAG
jgi:hypothetical protein